MLLSEQIAKIIEQMLEEGNGAVNVQRNDLAETLGCVPSQISYVISSRFTPERGYVTESRRGGGGYVRIVRMRAREEGNLLTKNKIKNLIYYSTLHALRFINYSYQ